MLDSSRDVGQPAQTLGLPGPGLPTVPFTIELDEPMGTTPHHRACGPGSRKVQEGRSWRLSSGVA